MFNRMTERTEECDARDDDSSNAAGSIKFIFKQFGCFDFKHRTSNFKLLKYAFTTITIKIYDKW